MFAQWHTLFVKDVKNSSVLESDVFMSVPSGLWQHIIMVAVVF